MKTKDLPKTKAKLTACNNFTDQKTMIVSERVVRTCKLVYACQKPKLYNISFQLSHYITQFMLAL